MNKFLLKLAGSALLAVVEPALRDALKSEVKVPDDQRKLLNKLGYGDAQLDAIDARVQGQIGDRVMREIGRALDKAVK